MQVIEGLRGKIYDLSAGKSTDDFRSLTSKASAKSMKKSADFQKRVELIGDFHFPGSSSSVKVSPDGEFIAATGNYPPTVKMFETSEMSMKFARGLDANATRVEFLSTDYKKFCLLNDNKVVDIHAQGGHHHSIKLPEYGRDLKFVESTAELLIACDEGLLVRLDLDDGRFLESKQSHYLSCLESLADNPRVPVVAIGGNDGIVELWDKRVDFKAVNHTVIDGGETVTALDFSSSGMELAVGAADGVVRVFDIRSSRPMAERNLMSSAAVVDCRFVRHALPGFGPVVVACDDYNVKVFALGGASDELITNPLLARDDSATTLLASFSSADRLHELCLYPDSGLLFAATAAPKMKIYFLPALGLAPKWCSLLDGITEELQATETVTLFDNKRFVTKHDLEELGATNLMATLKPHMHGFMMSVSLYDKLRSSADPFKYEEYRKRKIQARIEKKRPMRLKKSVPKVNADFHEKLSKKKQKNDKGSILDDPRFKDLFEQPEFSRQ